MSIAATETTAAAAEVFVPAAAAASRWRLAAAAAVVLVAAVATTWLLFPATWRSEQVLVVARSVPAGQLITAGDVRSERVRLAPGVVSVPAGELGSVVGRPAAVPLAVGVLLAPQYVGEVGPPAGRTLVAVAVPVVPAGVSAGTRVRVLVVADTGPAAAAGGDGGGPLMAWATVTDVDSPHDGGTWVVSLLLAEADGEAVAVAAATGRVSLVVAGAG